MRGCVAPHKYHVFLECSTLFSSMASDSSQGTVYILPSQFWHHPRLKGATNSLPIMPTQIIMSSPPCCRLNRVGAARPCATHPRDHPSGPSSVACISSVNRTRLKSCFRYWTDHARRFSLWMLVSQWRLARWLLRSSWSYRWMNRIWHHVVLFILEIPHTSKTCFLVWRGFFFTSLESRE